MRPLLYVLLAALVAFHLFVVVGNVAAFFILFTQPWYVALPVQSFLLGLMCSTRVECPLTNLENKLRKALGLKEVRGFIGFYILRPTRKLLGLKRPRHSPNVEKVGEQPLLQTQE